MRASRRSPYVAIAVLIAVVAAGVTALAFRFIPAAAGNGPTVVTAAAAAAGPRDTVTVIGEGTQLAAPDIAIVNIGVAPRRSTARDALNAENSEMTRLLQAIKARGVADADIQTTSLGVSQDTNCCPSYVIGYTASNSVVVKIHHLANVGTVIAAAADVAGNDIQLNGITLDLSDRASQLSAARQGAMASAATKAKNWAALAGRHLGKVLSVSEIVSNGTPQGPGCSGGCGGGGGAPVQAGQSSVVVDVTVVYELTD